MGMKLTKDYYAGGKSRIEGWDSKGWWFTGAGSFVSNGYVIYSNGLDGWLPNPNAILQGSTFQTRLLDTRSMDKRSSHFQFISQLQAIADKAAADERKYLTLKMEYLRKSDIDVEWRDKIIEAIEAGEYSAAYTLLLRRDKNLKEFQREISSNRNKSFARTNEFFNSQFYKFIAQKFEQQLSTQTGDTRTISLDQDFEELIDEFLNQVLGVSVDENQSLQYIKDSFVNGLNERFKESGGKFYNSVFLSTRGGETVLRRHKNNTHKFKAERWLKQKGEFRSPGAIAENIAYTLMKNIGKGLSTEAYQIGAWQDIGLRAFSTGNVKVDVENLFTGSTFKNVSGKNDIVIPEVFYAEITQDQMIQDLYAEGYDDQTKIFYDELEKRLKQQAAESAAGEFFETVVSTKGYLSNYDLTIAGDGSFSQRMSTIKKLNLDGGMAEKLIFMLNNTTNGCIMEGRQDEIADYIAAACVAWMWDNPEELVDLNQKAPGNYHKIRLFNSGGAYFTASQIIQQSINRLINYQDDVNRFVQVNIAPAPMYEGYDALIDQYPMDGIKGKDEWDATLKKMWDTVKADAMEKGTISIKFNQAELNELLGNLHSILGTN